MKKIIVLLVVIFIFVGCSSPILVKYSVYSNSGEFNILYSENIEETASLQWERSISSDGSVFIYVIPKTQDQILDVRVMYIANNGLELYERIISHSPVLIKGKIRALP